MDIAIRCRDLRKVYDGKPPVEAVRGLDLEVRAGECFGILGPNGAGKTTTVEILEGILEATGGEVEVLGLRWGRNDRALRERIGVSLQETRLADKLTVEETLELFGSAADGAWEPARSDLDFLVEFLPLKPGQPSCSARLQLLVLGRWPTMTLTPLSLIFCDWPRPWTP